MALNQAQLNELSKLEGFEKGFSKGERVAASGMGEMALVIIPGGGIIKIGRAGSKLAAAAYKRLANAFGPKVKLISKPSAKQVQNAQPPSTVLKADGTPKANVTLKSPTQVAVNRLSGRNARKRKAPASRTNTATVEKAPPKPAAPGLKKNRRRVDNKPDKPKPNVKSTRTLADDVKAAAAKRAAQQRMRQAQKRRATAAKVAGGTAAAAGLGVAAVGLNKAAKPKKAEASKRKPTGTYERTAVPTSKPKRKPTGTYERTAVPTGKPKRKPTGTYDRSAIATSKPKRKPTGTYDRRVIETSKPKKPVRKPSGPQTRGSQKRGATARITAGPNVGFGPKGNIFPKDAADRRRLMAKYGGTGSAAARAAAQGKQGNMKKGSK